MTARVRLRKQVRHLSLASCALLAVSATSPASANCPNGAQVDPQYCHFFIHYSNEPEGPIDAHIGDILGVTKNTQTRSIALIIAISKYPNMPNVDLSAAAKDGDKLVDFAVKSQRFDEVIALRDQEATAGAIDYFLKTYLPTRALDFAGKARLLIAYSGHGTSSNPTAAPAFVLSAATGPADAANTYLMSDLRTRIETLAGNYFHVLTLINACYGGNFLPSGNPGNADNVQEPGSYAITAGSDHEVAVSLNPDRGSVFFDLILDGIERGIADPLYVGFNVAGENGELLSNESLTRTSALNTYLTSAYDAINKGRSAWDKNFRKLDHTWIGPVASTGKGGAGGFFFVSPVNNENRAQQLAIVNGYSAPPGPANAALALGTTTGALIGPQAGAAAQGVVLHGLTVIPDQSVQHVAIQQHQATAAMPAIQQFSIPAGPISSIKGHPEVKVFKPSSVYPIRGYDVSAADGHIDWERLRGTDAPTFMYARALSWSGPDHSFPERWRNIAKVGFDRGAYVRFNFCQSADQQLGTLRSIVAPDPASLPIAIEIASPTSAAAAQQLCLSKSEVQSTRLEIIRFAEKLRAAYGKVPVLFGNRSDLTRFVDPDSQAYMLWLASYRRAGTAKDAIKLPGRNPWTLWQYSGDLDVQGIGKDTTGNVFFGTPDQYALFRAGRSNVALDAVK